MSSPLAIVEQGHVALAGVKFSEIKELDKFATVANDKIVVWRKLRDGEVYLIGEDPSDDYTCPQPNAVTDTGFPACFCKNDYVFHVDSTEYNDSVKLRRS